MPFTKSSSTVIRQRLGILAALAAPLRCLPMTVAVLLACNLAAAAADRVPAPDVKVVYRTTTTALASSLNPSIQGQNVLFTATVVASNGARPGGTVSFYIGNTLFVTRALTKGVAAFGTAGLPAGAMSFRAIYSGASGYQASISPTVVQTVRP